MDALRSGHRAVLLFVVQIEYAEGFSPNAVMDPEFAQKVKEAAEMGVEVLAYRCSVSPKEVKITGKVPVKI